MMRLKKPVPSAGTEPRGFSLIELLVVMGVATVMLGLAMTTIHLLLRAERHSAKTFWYGTSLTRFAAVLRNDVHAATTARFPGAVTGLDLTLPNGHAVAYRADAHTLTRIEESAGQPVHREDFHFPPTTRIRFEKGEQPNLIRGVIDRPSAIQPRMPASNGNAQSIRTARRVLRVEAVLNRDGRFAEVPE